MKKRSVNRRTRKPSAGGSSPRAALRLFLLLAALLGSFQAHGESAGSRRPYRIGVALLIQETNSFSPVATTLRDFEAMGLYYGEDILAASRSEQNSLGGFFDAVERFGEGRIEIVPVLQAGAMSGGPIQAEVYERFRREIVDGMTTDLDGIYLALHGAMGVAGVRDPEGDLLAALRAKLGDRIPIGVSLDLHANVTEARARLATFIVGYKTNPHRDFYETGFRTGEILVKTVLGEVHPTMSVQKMRLLKGGGMEIDFLAPMRKIFRRMKKMERNPAVLNVSNFMVHIWLDDPELGWTTVAVTDNDPELARETAETLADLNWSVRGVEHPEGLDPERAIEIARREALLSDRGTAMVCDASDAVGAGAPGENTWILKALVEKGTDLVSYVPLRDAEAAREACSAEIGSLLSLTVGGKLDKVYNRPLDFSGELVAKRDTQWGKTAILKQAGIHLILTELPVSAYAPSFFRDLGLDLWRADFVVVKNLFPFRITYWAYNRRTLNVITPGTTNVDVFQLEYERIPRPIYPLDEIGSWR